MGATANRLLAAGVRILGGCCGTTPDHLAAMSRVVRAVRMAN
jgi:homocysteine S-methyltransferase